MQPGPMFPLLVNGYHRVAKSTQHLIRAAAMALALIAGAVQVRADPAALRMVQQLDQQILDIGYRLAKAGGDLCARPVPLPGFVVHDLSQYDRAQQDDARAAFGFQGDPLVLAVAPRSPAAAGVQAQDALLSIDGARVAPAEREAKYSYARIAALLARIDAAAADGTLELGLRRGAEKLTVQIALEQGCPSKFQTNISDAINSRADGVYVEINSGLMAFAGTEEQIAAIVAHELAHNILRHRARLNAAGISRGLLGQLGRNARLIRLTEVEADRLSIHLLDRAGYPPQAAITFWERHDKRHGLDFLAPALLGEEARIAIFNEEIARIASMKLAGKPSRPVFMEGAELPILK